MGPEQPSAGTSQDSQQRRLNPNKASPEKSTNKPQCGRRPITTMIISWGLTQHAVRALLDTGCSVSSISTTITKQLDIPWIRRREAAPLLNCMGEEVKGAGMEYTEPLLLQCDTGVVSNRSVERIKGNQATFDNSQRNNLRSCVWVRWVVFFFFGEDVRAVSSSFRERRARLYSSLWCRGI